MHNIKEEEEEARQKALKNYPDLSNKQLAANSASYDRLQKRMDFRTRNIDRFKQEESRDLYRSRSQAPARKRKSSLMQKAKSFINKVRNDVKNAGRSRRDKKRRKRDESRSLYRSGNT